MMCLGVVSFMFLVFGICGASWICEVLLFVKIGNSSTIISSNLFFFFSCLLHSFSPSPSGIPIIYVLGHFKLTHSLLMLWFGEVSFSEAGHSLLCVQLFFFFW